MRYVSLFGPGRRIERMSVQCFCPLPSVLQQKAPKHTADVNDKYLDRMLAPLPTCELLCCWVIVVADDLSGTEPEVWHEGVSGKC